jgi:beta propeller domain-containing protein
MSSTSRAFGIGVFFSIGLVACGGGGGDRSAVVAEEPLNLDYSTLRLAESRETPLQYAANDEQILAPLRNGMRLVMTRFSPPPGIVMLAGSSTSYSGTTVQVAGVDEADAVRYDGSYIYAVRPQAPPPQSTLPQRSQNVLAIARTDVTAAKAELISNYVIEGEQSATPLLYQIPASGGRAEYLVAVSQDNSGWFMPLPITALVIQPDSTTVQLLDVRDPQRVSQAWKLRIDGWLNASRLIGDTLYLVSSYRPRIPDLVVPADTLEKQEANERRIRSSAAAQLLPHYSVDGGAMLPLVSGHGCLIAQQLPSNEAYTDLLVISAINVRTRRISDANCLSTNVNGVYMATTSLYVAGTRRADDGTMSTVLHKFAIDDGQMSYRATGAVPGTVGWPNGSYFMDEHGGDLRILTSRSLEHRLTVLRESGKSLVAVSTLPDASRPEPIGKPDESVYAVRFVADRAYVVTFRLTDPLYVIDLHDPLSPAIAGQLEIPGVSSYLRAVGPYLLSVGQDATNGRRTGMKVELFDVSDIAHPRSAGVQTFGKTGTWSDALSDPHALTFAETAGPDASLRLALPIDVHDTPVGDPTLSGWTYSGLHVLEVSGIERAAPQLKLQGVIKTAERGSSTIAPYVYSRRAVLHDDAVFAVHGDQILSQRWQELH